MKNIFDYNNMPDIVNKSTICPHCNKGIQPLSIFNINVDKNDMFTCYVAILRCPICKRHYIVDYIINDSEDEIHINATYPFIKNKIVFSKEIQKLSSEFIKIYAEAEQAEAQSLNSIAGVGYRKALEFLIKDYCISNNPSDTSKIEQSPLSFVIENYIDSENIKTLAKAATWIGNDETHYVRKHHDYDCNSLKAFIEVTVRFIDDQTILKNAYDLINK